jgi:hypothetical protein
LGKEIEKVNGLRQKYRKFPPSTTNFTIKRYIRSPISGEDLMRIFIYPKAIDLGKVNVKSTEMRNFCIKNEMTTHIIARINTELEELQDSYKIA